MKDKEIILKDKIDKIRKGYIFPDQDTILWINYSIVDNALKRDKIFRRLRRRFDRVHAFTYRKDVGIPNIYIAIEKHFHVDDNYTWRSKTYHIYEIKWDENKEIFDFKIIFNIKEFINLIGQESYDLEFNSLKVYLSEIELYLKNLITNFLNIKYDIKNFI